MPIRAASFQDLDLIQQIQQENLGSSAGAWSALEDLELLTPGLHLENLTRAIHAGQLFVAVDAQRQPRGFSRFDPRSGEITVTCVALSHQREGLGRELVRECLKRARDAQVQSVRVAAPLDAVAFYERLEFEIDGREEMSTTDGAIASRKFMTRPVMLPSILENIQALRESVEFFAPGPGKNYAKERIAVRGFLRGLRIDFKDEEITQGDDPPDVCFRAGKFEVKALYDEDRRMHKEYKDKLQASGEAFFLADLVEGFTPRVLVLADVMLKVIKVVVDQGSKYLRAKRAELDFVVYVNLQHVFEIKASPWPDLTKLAAEGWRSVSFVCGSKTSYVLTTREDAPDFLRAACGAPQWESESRLRGS